MKALRSPGYEFGPYRLDTIGRSLECRGEVIANLADVQARMDHQDEEAADRERQVARGDQPVTNPHPRCVAARSQDGTYCAAGAAPRRVIRYSDCRRQVLPPSLDASSR